MQPGIRRICVAYDVERYSGRGNRREYIIQQHLADVMDFVFAEVGLTAGEYEIQEQGDGGIALLPTGGNVNEPRLLVGLIGAFRNALTELNEDLIEDARVRLRIGLDQGVIHRAGHGYVGSAVVNVCRLRDAEVVRTVLAGSGAPFVVAASDSLYKDVLAHGYHGLPGSAFTPADVQAKAFAGRAWIYLPGADAGPAREKAPDDTQESGTFLLGKFLDAPRDVW